MTWVHLWSPGQWTFCEWALPWNGPSEGSILGCGSSFSCTGSSEIYVTSKKRLSIFPSSSVEKISNITCWFLKFLFLWENHIQFWILHYLDSSHIFSERWFILGNNFSFLQLNLLRKITVKCLIWHKIVNFFSWDEICKSQVPLLYGIRRSGQFCTRSRQDIFLRKNNNYNNNWWLFCQFIFMKNVLNGEKKQQCLLHIVLHFVIETHHHHHLIYTPGLCYWHWKI